MKTKTSGAFAQDKNGKWMIDTKVKVDGEFKHLKRTGYPTLSSAKADFEKQKELFIQANTKHHKVVVFDDLLEKYSEMRKITVDISTQDCDKSLFNVYMLPYFKGELLSKCLTKESIYDWYHDIVDSPKYTNNKKSKVITRMKDLLKFAYMHEYIDAPTYQACDVCLYQVKYIKTPAHERIVWTKEEETAFFKSLENNYTDLLMFKLFFHCSPRLGEFLALMPSCVDFDNEKITIKQQVKNISGKGVILTAKLKTNESYRTMILNQQLCDELKDYINQMGIAESEYIFCGLNRNVPMSRNTFRRKLYKYCDMANVRRINPHASRHLQATKLAKACHTAQEIEASARRLGHSPEMFLNTYAKHTNDKTEQDLIKCLG